MFGAVEAPHPGQVGRDEPWGVFRKTVRGKNCLTMVHGNRFFTSKGSQFLLLYRQE